MAVNGDALAALIQTKMDTKFKTIVDYGGPLAQQNPSYFIQFCQALGTGIVLGSPVINFTTADTGATGSPPRPGVGLGVGIIVDKAWFTEKLYSEIRNQSIAAFGSTTHPADKNNPYGFLTALSEAISESVTEHYAVARILNSTHATVYAGTGVINNGMFSGVSHSTVASSIQGLAPALQGSFWPSVCQSVGVAYADAIQLHSTGVVTVTGICSPSQSQTCGVPGNGSGIGTAT